jgi:hypothetical protein
MGEPVALDVVVDGTVPQGTIVDLVMSSNGWHA